MKKNGALLVAAVICVVALAGMTVALVWDASRGDYVPPKFDRAAKSGTPEVPAELGWGEIDAKVFRAGVCGSFRPTGNRAAVWLYNPAENAVWLKLRVLDAEGNILGETGLLKPGEYVETVALDAVPTAGTAVSLKLMAYEPETYHSAGAALLNTTVE